MKFVLIKREPTTYEARNTMDQPLGKVQREYRHVHKEVKGRGLHVHTAVPVWVFHEPNGTIHEPRSTRLAAINAPVWAGDDD